MKYAVSSIALAPLMLAAPCAAAPDYKDIALALYTSVTGPIAISAYVEDCGEPDASGRVVCHSCYNELTLEKKGDLFAYADRNEQIIVGAPTDSKLSTTREFARHSSDISPAQLAIERSKGSVSLKNYMTILFEDGDKWCASFGGDRHEVANKIDVFASGEVSQ